MLSALQAARGGAPPAGQKSVEDVMRILWALLMAASTALLAPGCQQHPPLARNVKAPALQMEPYGLIPPERQPSMVGDVLVYPIKWRRADELAAQLYDMLYPK